MQAAEIAAAAAQTKRTAQGLHSAGALETGQSEAERHLRNFIDAIARQAATAAANAAELAATRATAADVKQFSAQDAVAFLAVHAVIAADALLAAIAAFQPRPAASRLAIAR